jgi:hypothetical protein
MRVNVHQQVRVPAFGRDHDGPVAIRQLLDPAHLGIEHGLLQRVHADSWRMGILLKIIDQLRHSFLHLGRQAMKVFQNLSMNHEFGHNSFSSHGTDDLFHQR